MVILTIQVFELSNVNQVNRMSPSVGKCKINHKIPSKFAMSDFSINFGT